MTEDVIEITLSGASTALVTEAADQLALALMGAGASVNFQGREPAAAAPRPSLRGIPAMIRIAPALLPRVPPGSHAPPSFRLGGYGKTIASVIAVLALLRAEVRLNFGLQFDAIILAVCLLVLWRWIARGNSLPL